ncbi:ABC-2 type transport system ATP-binding protein [Methanofollis sp. W23]|uniref:ABC transporter ATP-binding protein n=1 Tax=Methanofollis sp. W23 TaxID=2817849 RepID=UPI001AE73976|nr:ABC transporter ATP-binding protein [Methanofollis sp. W23]MBP2146704.1 ABC-2 type transport system ATP-binding protein [Methanofollis sp. W23]
MIRCEHLCKVYHGVPAVDDLCLEVPEGEVFGLLGPNGAGKSTTILMLTGLIEPTSGACYIDDLEVATHPIEVKKKIGYMPEDVGFYPTLTAEENLEYSAKLYGMGKERKERIQELLTLVGLEGVTKEVGGFSKGMRQRLGIAKALINHPRAIILDEPTANLDPQGVADYRRIIRQVADQGTTVLVSSHILSEVSKVCTSAGILAHGKLVAHGTWDELARVGGDEQVVIHIETRTPMPDLQSPALVAAEFAENRHRARIVATVDIRDELADTLAKAGVAIRSLEAEHPDIEDVFLSYYHATEEAA